MRIKKLTPIIVSLIVLAVITAILVRYRSVEAQEDRAAKAPIGRTAKASATNRRRRRHYGSKARNNEGVEHGFVSRCG